MATFDINKYIQEQGSQETLPSLMKPEKEEEPNKLIDFYRRFSQNIYDAFEDKEKFKSTFGPKIQQSDINWDEVREYTRNADMQDAIESSVAEALGILEEEPAKQAQDQALTTLLDITDTDEGKLSNPEPLYEMAKEVDPGTIETKEIGLMSPPPLPPSESRSGVFEMAETDAMNIAIDKIGIDEEMWESYKKEVAKIESGGEKNPYGAKGGYNKHYDGKYQVGKDAKADAASLLGITLGHSKKERDMFRKNPALQEKIFAAYTARNHQYMLNKSEIYRNLDKKQQLAVLGYAHNQGAGGASKWLRSGQAARDGFDTSADKYYKAIAKDLGITPSLAFTEGRGTSPRPMLRPEEE